MFMDHSELLFAMKVRELAIGRLSKNAPENLTSDGRREHIRKLFPETVAEVVREIEEVAEMVAKARQS